MCIALLSVRSKEEDEYEDFEDNDDKEVSVEVVNGEDEAGTAFSGVENGEERAGNTDVVGWGDENDLILGGVLGGDDVGDGERDDNGDSDKLRLNWYRGGVTGNSGGARHSEG